MLWNESAEAALSIYLGNIKIETQIVDITRFRIMDQSTTQEKYKHDQVFHNIDLHVACVHGMTSGDVQFCQEDRQPSLA